MQRIHWMIGSLLVGIMLVLAGCANDETAPGNGATTGVANPLIGTWQIYNDPSTSAHWIFDPTLILYQELADATYVKHSYTVTGSQLVIRSGLNQGTYGFTRDANQLTLVNSETNQTIFFRWISDTRTPPGMTP